MVIIGITKMIFSIGFRMKQLVLRFKSQVSKQYVFFFFGENVSIVENLYGSKLKKFNFFKFKTLEKYIFIRYVLFSDYIGRTHISIIDNLF